MVGNDGIEIVIENDIHGFDSQRVTVALENIVDPFGRTVFPTVDLSMVTGLEKALLVQFVKLIHVFGMADDMVIGLFASGGIEIADDQVASDAEMLARGYQFLQPVILFEKAMMSPAQMDIGHMQQAKPRHVDTRYGDIARHIIVFAMIRRNISRIIMPHRMAAHDGGAFPPAIKSDVAPILMNVKPMPPLAQFATNPKSHVGGRFAVGLSDSIVQIFPHFLKTNDVYP